VAVSGGPRRQPKPPHEVAEREIALADVLAPMLATPDMWTGFADAYLAELWRSRALTPISCRRGPRGDAEILMQRAH
jgi:hypothetical protein